MGSHYAYHLSQVIDPLQPMRILWKDPFHSHWILDSKQFCNYLICPILLRRIKSESQKSGETSSTNEAASFLNLSAFILPCMYLLPIFSSWSEENLGTNKLGKSFQCYRMRRGVAPLPFALAWLTIASDFIRHRTPSPVNPSLGRKTWNSPEIRTWPISGSVSYTHLTLPTKRIV